MFRFSAPPPLSLYIHFPWCVRKCPYCDFNSHPVREELPENAYVDALLEDLEQELPAVWGRSVQTLFMGGGTPSLFSPQAIDRLLSGIRARVPLSPRAEITLEANPGTIEQARFAAYREAGINRLSIGIQSLNDAHLSALGRIHDAAQGRQAARAARAAGFDNFNLDLMFGLPAQSVDEALEDLAATIDLQPTHLSWYQLTLEPNTLFAAQPPTLPDEDLKWEIQERGQSLCAAAGYTRYEVSALSLPENQCRHNLNYWRFGDYVGIGAGAHSKISDAAGGAIRRSWKKRHPAAYMASVQGKAFREGERTLTPAEAVFEFVLNRLRLRAPFSLAEFETASGLGRAWIVPLIRAAQADELLNFDGEQVQHSARGWLFLDDLLERFLPEVDPDARDRTN